MRKRLLYLVIPIVLILSGFMTWQNMETQHTSRREHRIVMQITQSDSLTQLAVIGQIRNIKSGLPDSHIEVVCHAHGLEMLMAGKSKVLRHIAELSDQNVTFAACENTMKRKNIQRHDLAPEVKTVPSALVEIILRQEDGWSYVKGGD
jgi:uncharacterized protein